jgi:hypothetical protein
MCFVLLRRLSPSQRREDGGEGVLWRSWIKAEPSPSLVKRGE